MKRSRFSGGQVSGILKAAENGRMVADVCRAHSISDSTYFNWKAKYGGMTAAEIKRLRELEEENRQLKRMFADLSLENRVLKDLIKKRLVTAERREAVSCLKSEQAMSERRACDAVEISRLRYRGWCIGTSQRIEATAR